jgi:H/ACA ribonucleoprotein complex subunit 4
MALVKQKQADGEDEEMVIKPENVGPKIDTTEWPLLLKNWDQREYKHL